jgi:Mrp family chromosome partitioning ATPase
MAVVTNPNTIVTLESPDSVGAEAYRTLRTNITMRGFGKPIKLINIVSANAQEAKTTTAVNLAIVYSQLGKKPCLFLRLKIYRCLSS